MNHNSSFQIAIIGSGPAGYTAALYAARANLNPVVYEGYLVGGQLMTTTDVENFPGYPKGVTGPELMSDLKEQAVRFGAVCQPVFVDSLKRLDSGDFLVQCGHQSVTVPAVILATGASAKYIGLENERRLLGRGVSACATCDGAFFKNEKLAIVGGGDTAMEEALFLTRFASEVVLIHRRDTLRASQIMQDRVKSHPKIRFYWNTVVEDCLGENQLTGLKLKNLETGTTFEESFGGLFVAIGHTPNSDLVREWVETDSVGYIQTIGKSTQTSVLGLFACGDVQDPTYRQAITAAGSGCSAAIDAERYLESRHTHSQLNEAKVSANA